MEDVKTLCNVLGKLGFVWNDREGKSVLYRRKDKIIYLDTNVISYVRKKGFEEVLGDKGLEIRKRIGLI